MAVKRDKLIILREREISTRCKSNFVSHDISLSIPETEKTFSLLFDLLFITTR